MPGRLSPAGAGAYLNDEPIRETCLSAPVTPAPLPAVARAAYVIGPLLMLVPLVDAMTVLFAPNLFELRWRFGAAGIMSSALMTPLFGLFVVIAAALLLEHRRLARALGWLSLAAGVMILAGTVVFVMDFAEIRHLAARGSQGEITVASLKALVKMLIALAAAVSLGFITLRATRTPPAPQLAADMVLGTSLSR